MCSSKIIFPKEIVCFCDILTKKIDKLLEMVIQIDKNVFEMIDYMF